MKCLVATILLCGIALLSFARQSDTVYIRFAFNQSDITTEYSVILDSLLDSGNHSRIQTIHLSGHCDFIGSHSYNDVLSQARVDAVRQYLITGGMAASQVVVEGAFGKRRPLRADSTDEARAMNRRVELVVHYTAEPPPAPSVIAEKIRDTAVVKTGSTLVLEHLNFEGGRHFLLPESRPILEDLLRALKENPEVAIEIQGHVCCTGPNEDGLDLDLGTYDLSVQRARAIYNYLVQNGIDSQRLQYKGLGGRYKIFPYELTEEERSKNRRVEIKILKR
jgi:outer membrane protein OmpA-like peptidoglycan-associated protein